MDFSFYDTLFYNRTMILLGTDINHTIQFDNLKLDFYPITDYRLIKRDFECIGFFYWKEEGENVSFSELVFENCSLRKQEFHQYLDLVSEFFTKRKEFKRILYLGKLHKILLNSHLYFQKGSIYQRIIEPWRDVIDNSAFDEEGYIINQDKTEVLPFGFTNSKRAGCGWIAAYNLLKINHREKTMNETFFGLSEYHILTGEVFGQNIYLLYYWLKKQGLRVHMTHLSQKACIEQMKNSSSGILLYYHKRGSHFTTYKKLEDGTFKLYNAIYGKQNHISTMEEFIQKHSRIPLNFLIYIK